MCSVLTASLGIDKSISILIKLGISVGPLYCDNDDSLLLKYIHFQLGLHLTNFQSLHTRINYFNGILNFYRSSTSLDSSLLQYLSGK